MHPWVVGIIHKPTPFNNATLQIRIYYIMINYIVACFICAHITVEHL